MRYGSGRDIDEHSVRAYAKLPLMLTPAQVALQLNVSRKTVYRWIRDGKLKPVRSGEKLWQVPLPELESFLRDSTTAPEPEPDPAPAPAPVVRNKPKPKGRR